MVGLVGISKLRGILFLERRSDAGSVHVAPLQVESLAVFCHHRAGARRSGVAGAKAAKALNPLLWHPAGCREWPENLVFARPASATA